MWLNFGFRLHNKKIALNSTRFIYMYVILSLNKKIQKNLFLNSQVDMFVSVVQ